MSYSSGFLACRLKVDRIGGDVAIDYPAAYVRNFGSKRAKKEVKCVTAAQNSDAGTGDPLLITPQSISGTAVRCTCRKNEE